MKLSLDHPGFEPSDETFFYIIQLMQEIYVRLVANLL